MEITKASLYKAKLGLKKSFEHGSFKRNYNETIFLELKNNKGMSGFGECLSRKYVTGENPKKIIENLKKYISNMPKKFNSVDEIAEFLYICEGHDSKNMASLCGIDMALLDLYGKSKDKSVSRILCEERGYERKRIPRITSGTLGLNSPEWKKIFYCLGGIKDIKLKITPNTNPKKIKRIGKGIIHPRTFRLDGNCSLNHDELAELLINGRVKVDYIEQPFPVNIENPKWNEIKFLADESLINLNDAKKINFDAANIRIGKNGGILRTLEIIKEWEKRNKKYMLGSLVGETSLLSASLLHIAFITNPFLNEGCYSTRLLKKEPTNIHLSVGYKGEVKFDYSKSGLGVDLCLFDKRLRKMTSSYT